MTGRLVVTLSNDVAVPRIIVDAGSGVRRRFLEFFGASIRNVNTRTAYLSACNKFFGFLDDHGIRVLEDIEPLHVAAWVEALRAGGLAVASQKQHMAAVRTLLDYLVSGGLLAHNPSLSVRTDRHSVSKGKTPTLTADECGSLLRSINTSNVVGLRDRALIGVMVFTFARVSAAVGLRIEDIYRQKTRLWIRLHEKGGKVHDMPCHHRLEEYLAEYIDAAGLSGSVAGTAVFQSCRRRRSGSGEPSLSGRPYSRMEAWAMVRRRAVAAGIDTKICNHTFRGTGITTYLENGGTLEKARQMAAHASTRTTQLYDRRSDDVTLDEIVKIDIKG